MEMVWSERASAKARVKTTLALRSLAHVLSNILKILICLIRKIPNHPLDHVCHLSVRVDLLTSLSGLVIRSATVKRFNNFELSKKN